MNKESEGFLLRFSEILGQEKAKSLLLGSIQNRRVPHAYLFTGIPGVGKTSSAKALAAAINCQDKMEGDACGNCLRCRQMKSGNFPDFILVRPDKDSIKIEQIRELQRSLRFAPVLGGYRVCVIDQADTMTEEACNSFLKSLEEPPPKNIFILNVIEPLNLLPTVVSRCQKISFRPLPKESVKKELKKRLGMGEKTAEVLARICEGSLGKALAMAEADYLGKRQYWLKKLNELQSLPDADLLEQGHVMALGMKKEETEENKYGIGGILDMLSVWASWYRDLILIKERGDERLLINYNFYDQLKKEVRNYSINNLCKKLSIIDRAQRDLRLYRNRSLVLGRTFIQLKNTHKSDTYRYGP